MPKNEIDTGATGDTGMLAADTLFAVAADDWIEFSTDGGTTFIPFLGREKVVFSSGLTVHYRNSSNRRAVFFTMPI